MPGSTLFSFSSTFLAFSLTGRFVLVKPANAPFFFGLSKSFGFGAKIGFSFRACFYRICTQNVMLIRNTHKTIPFQLTDAS